jgi:hypothetical protein
MNIKLKDDRLPSQALALLLTSHSIITIKHLIAKLAICCIGRLRLESSKRDELHVINGSRGAVRLKNPARTGVSHTCPCSELESFVPTCSGTSQYYLEIGTSLST